MYSKIKKVNKVGQIILNPRMVLNQAGIKPGEKVRIDIELHKIIVNKMAEETNK